MRALVLSLIWVVILWADWSENPGEPLSLGSGIDPQVKTTSDGGAYVAWLSDGNFHIYLQRVDALGNPQWTAGGVLVSNAPNSSWIAVYHLNLVVDSDDNAIISTVDTRNGNWEVYLFKIDGSGNQLWGENGLQLSNSGNDNISPRLALNGFDNSVIVTWSDNFMTLRLQRVSAGGQLLWGESGINVSSFNASLVSPQAKMDTEGEYVLVQAIKQTGSFPALSSQVVQQKYSMDGAAQWTGWSQLGPSSNFPLGNWSQDVSLDSGGGTYASWTELTQQNQTAKVQRVNANGDLGWATALELSSETTRFRVSPRIATPANSSNVYAIWSESDANQINRGIQIQNLDSTGTRLWGTNGMSLESLGTNVFFDVQVDTWDGDLFAAYIRQSSNGSKDVIASRVTADGSFAWEDEHVILTTSGTDKGGLSLSRGQNSTILVWEESGSIKAHSLKSDGTLGVDRQPHGMMLQVPADFATIQSAIDAAESGDTILVAPGTYPESINYSGKNVVVGSHILTTGDPVYIGTTIIDGNRNATVVTFNSGESNESVFVGFTVQNGAASLSDPDGDGDSSSYGGGILCVNANPQFKHLIIQNNSAQGGGGGGLFCYNASPSLEDVQFFDNSSQDVGGAIYAKLNCDLKITRASFSGNTCPTVGAAIYARDNSTLSLDHVLISRNYSDHAGGGIGLKAGCEAILTHVTITDNFALHHGGSLYSNSSNFTLVNTILWNNDGGEVYFADFDDPNQILISHSTVQDSIAGITTSDNGSILWQDGNLGLNPVFADTMAGDYSLGPHSPCRDAGTTMFIVGDDTLFHTDNYQGMAPDMGFRESTPDTLNYFPMALGRQWQMASEIDTTLNTIIDTSFIEGFVYYEFDAWYEFESINPFRAEGNEILVWNDSADEKLYDFSAYLGETWTFNHGESDPSEMTLAYIGETITTPLGTFENCLGFHRFIGADYEFYDWFAPDVGLVQREVITFAGPRRYSLIDTSTVMVSIDETKRSHPAQLSLKQNYPNPFNPSTTIRYELSKRSQVGVTIYDLNGSQVYIVQPGAQDAGSYSITWSGTDTNGHAVPAGLYFCRLNSDSFDQTIKMLLLR